MPTYKSAFNSIRAQISTVYEKAEANAITRLLLEDITNISYSQSILKDVELTPNQTLKLEQYTHELLASKPIQYIIGKAHFYGLDFIVNEAVLIPRPETEELVAWCINDLKGKEHKTILDIGTGSGCIPITLKKNLSHFEITSCEISIPALEVAKKNAQLHQTEIDFINADFLNENENAQLSNFDVIISNPPYIPLSFLATIEPNVKDYEPHLALFVADENPLIFYKTIAQFGKKHLHFNGCIYIEFHFDQAENIRQIFQSEGYEIILKKDMFGKDRMAKATKTRELS